MSADWKVTKRAPEADWPHECETLDKGELHESAVWEVRFSVFLQLVVLEIIGIELNRGGEETDHPCHELREHIKALREAFYTQKRDGW